jgi:hypothetical protein
MPCEFIFRLGRVRMVEKGVFKWLTLDMMIFMALNATLIPLLGTRLASLREIGFLQFIVLGLAAYRASNILSNEVVTKPLRTPFVDEVEKDGKMVEEPKKSGFLGATGLLIYCPSCTGVWLSAALAYGYALWPTQAFLIALLLSMSAVERTLAAVIGWFRRGA